MSDELLQAIRQARQQPAVAEALTCIYADLQRQTELRQPRCVASGRCCHFEAYGHRLYVSTAELAYFADRFAAPPAATTIKPRATQAPEVLPVLQPSTGQCPLLVDGLCGVHPIRPFGCRIFFCDESAEQWQQTLYEQTHQRIKSLHDSLAIPYLYVEWRQALATMRDAGLISF